MIRNFASTIMSRVTWVIESLFWINRTSIFLLSTFFSRSACLPAYVECLACLFACLRLQSTLDDGKSTWRWRFSSLFYVFAVIFHFMSSNGSSKSHQKSNKNACKDGSKTCETSHLSRAMKNQWKSKLCLVSFSLPFSTMGAFILLFTTKRSKYSLFQRDLLP